MNNKNGKSTNLWGELAALKDAVISEMSTQKNETTKLRLLNDWLRRELDFETRHDAFLAELEGLVNERRAGARQDSPPDVISRLSGDTAENDDRGGGGSEHSGGKQRARECRSTYVEHQKRLGKVLKHHRSAYYRTAAGLVVGITYSSEKSDKKDTWFLNLREGQFQEAVLLCDTGRDFVQAIYLPKRFLEKYSRNMSRDHKGQIKFNVTKTNGKYHLLVPEPVGPVDVMEYLDGSPLLCPCQRYV